MPGNGSHPEYSGVIAIAALTRTVHGQKGHTHARKAGLLRPAAGGTGIAMELQHQRHGGFGPGPQILCVHLRPVHARKPQIQKFALGRAGNLPGLGEGEFQRNRVCLGHPCLPEPLKILRLGCCPQIITQGLDFFRCHKAAPLSKYKKLFHYIADKGKIQWKN